MSDANPDTDDADWTFGDGGFVKIYGDRLAASSLLDTAVATRWAFFVMASQADSKGRFRCATTAALARAANISNASAKKAIRELTAEDVESTSKAEGGRRIVPIPGGWRIVNYEHYRDFRTKKQIEDAERKRKQRERDAEELARLRKGKA